ncbi:MAG: hypothetical protein A2Z29_00275 [Chloroflexi bacterium RBG_16_56_11]|nr:MAG: hypothetical protein A2Z29_00275 [Chloroflexi bacterium RBG_16_56_11]
MKKLYVTFLALVLVLAMIVPVGAVQAGSPRTVVFGEIKMEWNGFFEMHNSIGERGIMFSSIGFTDTYIGRLIGTANETSWGNINDTNYGTYTGMFFSMGTVVFEGSLMGKTGTFTAEFWRMGKGGTDGYAKGEQTIISGTGDLEKLRGTITYTVNPQSDGSYAGRYFGKLHFDP